MSSTWLSVSQAAKILAVNPKSIDYLINNKKVEFIRPGRRKRLISQSEITRLKNAKQSGQLFQTAAKKFQDQQNVKLKNIISNYPLLIDVAQQYQIKYSVFWREIKNKNIKTVKFDQHLYLPHEELQKLDRLFKENRIFKRARQTQPDQTNSHKKEKIAESYTIKSAAKILNVNPRTLQFYCVNQTIKTISYCGRHYITDTELSRLQQSIHNGLFLTKSHRHQQENFRPDLASQYQDYLTLEQLAAKLNINPSTLYNYHYRRCIPGTIFRGKLIFSPHQYHRIKQLIDQEIILVDAVSRRKITDINHLAKHTKICPTELTGIFQLSIEQLSPAQFRTLIFSAKAGNQLSFEYILRQSVRLIKYWSGYFAKRFSTTFPEAIHYAQIGVFIAVRNYHKLDQDFGKFLKYNIIWSIKRESYREFCGKIIDPHRPNLTKNIPTKI